MYFSSKKTQLQKYISEKTQLFLEKLQHQNNKKHNNFGKNTTFFMKKTQLFLEKTQQQSKRKNYNFMRKNTTFSKSRNCEPSITKSMWFLCFLWFSSCSFLWKCCVFQNNVFERAEEVIAKGHRRIKRTKEQGLRISFTALAARKLGGSNSKSWPLACWQ